MAQFRKDKYTYNGDNDTLFEVMMLSDIYGNAIGGANPSGMAVDAFGRARVSSPLTLFDSYHRYQDNGKVGSYTAGGGVITHDANSSSILLSVGTANGDEAIRETSRVFAYQPGKSLQILMTFVMNTAKTNLRQRAGYFDTENGIFLEQDNSTISFVRRSYTSGSVVDTKIARANWNMDKLDGTGPSKKTLDLSKAQILFIDIEWLGVGSVRCGFVIDGQFIHCHSFHHSNVITNSYMTTAILPGRVEITNTGTTASASTYKQICFSVISEGGYELRGRQKTISTPINSPKTLTVAGTYYPIISLRLRPDRLNAVSILKNLHLLGIGNNTRLSWKIVANTTLTSPSWTNYSTADSYCQYDMSSTAMTGGTDLSSGFLSVTNQSAQVLSLDSGTFKYQLERNTFTATPYTLTIAVAGLNAGNQILASIDWEEV